MTGSPHTSSRSTPELAGDGDYRDWRVGVEAGGYVHLYAPNGTRIRTMTEGEAAEALRGYRAAEPGALAEKPNHSKVIRNAPPAPSLAEAAAAAEVVIANATDLAPGAPLSYIQEQATACLPALRAALAAEQERREPFHDHAKALWQRPYCECAACYRERYRAKVAELDAALAADEERRQAMGQLVVAATEAAVVARLDARRQCEPGCDCWACELDAALARLRALEGE